MYSVCCTLGAASNRHRCLLLVLAGWLAGWCLYAGMLIGIVGAMASFVLAYASLRHVSVTAFRTSNMVRTFEEQAVLASCRGKVVTISLSGFIFFGSAVQLLEEVKRHVIVVEDESEAGGDGEMVGGSCDQPNEHTPLVMRWRQQQATASSFSSLASSSPMLIQLPASEQHSSQQSKQLSSSHTSQSSHHSHSSSAPSFSHLAPIYDLSSDQIMRQHEKWQKCVSAENTPQRSTRARGPMVGGSAEMAHVRFDIESNPTVPAKKRGDSSSSYAYFVDGYGGEGEAGSQSPTPVTTTEGPQAEEEEEEEESLLQSIWNTQAHYRSHRKRSTSESLYLMQSGPSSSNLQLQNLAVVSAGQASGLGEGKGGAGRSKEKEECVSEVRTEFMVLNFTDVSGVDATAARSCFLMLVQLLRNAGATVVFACPRLDIRVLLGAHGVILDADKVTDTLDSALEWCEEQVLFRWGGV
jgi:hypothetical protein